MAQPTRFVRTEWEGQLIGPKHFRKGSVVEVSETRARHMVDCGAAVFCDGPESEPPAPEPEAPADADRKAKK